MAYTFGKKMGAKAPMSKMAPPAKKAMPMANEAAVAGAVGAMKPAAKKKGKSLPPWLAGK